MKMSEIRKMDFLKDMREKKGLTKYAMALELGMSPQHYTQLEASSKGTSNKNWVKIKRYIETQGISKDPWNYIWKKVEKEVDGGL